MKKHVLLTLVIAFGLLSVATMLPLSQASDWRNRRSKDLDTPAVFQGAGPTKESIEGVVDEFRAALGEPNNGNNVGPLANGRREINWTVAEVWMLRPTLSLRLMFF